MTASHDEAARDRARGALLGLAVGDALGTTLEFKPKDRYQPLTTIVGVGPFSLDPGEWTDDTSMALALATSLIEKGGLDERDLMDRFCAWAERGSIPTMAAASTSATRCGGRWTVTAELATPLPEATIRSLPAMARSCASPLWPFFTPMIPQPGLTLPAARVR